MPMLLELFPGELKIIRTCFRATWGGDNKGEVFGLTFTTNPADELHTVIRVKDGEERWRVSYLRHHGKYYIDSRRGPREDYMHDMTLLRMFLSDRLSER